MLIDTHGHVNFNAFKEDTDEVLKRALENGVWVVLPGSQYSTSRRAVEVAQKYEKGVYAAVGLHPIHLGEQRHVDVLETQSVEKNADTQPWETFITRHETFDYDAYKHLATQPKVVAIGEFGLDYYRMPKGKARREEIKKVQKETFEKQLDLAEDLRLAVLLHCRMAFDDMYEILAKRAKQLRGVVHSYTGNAEQAKGFLNLGLNVGFNALILKNVPALPNPEEVISQVPLEKIVLETDSPYLRVPVEVFERVGVLPLERNEPVCVKYVEEEIARIKKISFEEVADQTTANAKKMLRI